MKLMSNGSLSITSRSDADLHLALKMANIHARLITAWSMHGAAVMWLFDHIPPEADDVHPFPFALSEASLFTLTRDWLASVADDDRLDRPDHFDGSMKPDGWRIRVGVACTGNAAIEIHALWSHFHK